ncbi:hypothetical protein BDF14DRAFT_1879634 [Spinellus fusiger]|nr:hypothetical protein BDF14DRAFT_1879634 [Spinellus fusiger]
MLAIENESKTDSKYIKRVSFDIMTHKDLRNYSFTLRGKTHGYKRTRRTRTFIIATDLANYSEFALKWANDEVMDDGDELIVLRVITLEPTEIKAPLLKYEQEQAKQTASLVMEKIMASSSDERRISVIIEFVIGKVQETIQDMIAMYQPSLLIVGTRGLSDFKKLLLGSVSRYCLQHSPVPVVVVRLDAKIKKNKTKKNRLSGLIRLSGSGNGTNASSQKSSTSDSSSDEDERERKTKREKPKEKEKEKTETDKMDRVDKKLNRLSLFENFGRRSRSPSPAPAKIR